MDTIWQKHLALCVACFLAASTAIATEQEVLEKLTEMIAASPDTPEPYVARSQIYSSAGRHTDAIADLNQAIKLKPESASLVDLRGSERLLNGEFDKAIGDFDQYLAKRPDQKPYHWKRGIALYYAGRYDDGVKQFDIHQTVNSADVENAVWRYLCMAKRDGVKAARKDLLKVGPDSRVPMKEVYDLFAGKSPDEVIAATKVGDPDSGELRIRLFYAHLYLALYFDAQGDVAKARDHLKLAVNEYPIDHYMGGIAKVHLAVLQKQAKRGKP